LKNDPEFRDKIAMLCETCILKIMQNIEDSDQIVQKDPISKVTRFLEPEKI